MCRCRLFAPSGAERAIGAGDDELVGRIELAVRERGTGPPVEFGKQRVESPQDRAPFSDEPIARPMTTGTPETLRAWRRDLAGSASSAITTPISTP